MEIHIANTARLALGSRWPDVWGALTPEERQRASRFLRDSDRTRYITGVLLTRAAAAERTGSWWTEIRRNEFGKPFLSGDDSFYFNLSHSDDLVVFAQGDAPVGVDVERIAPIEWRQLASVFSDEERAMLDRSTEPLRLFYRMWTAREAFAKEEGVGLSIFEGDVRLDYRSQTVRYGDRVLPFRTLYRGGYWIAVCSRALFPLSLMELDEQTWARRVRPSE